CVQKEEPEFERAAQDSINKDRQSNQRGDNLDEKQRRNMGKIELDESPESQKRREKNLHANNANQTVKRCAIGRIRSGAGKQDEQGLHNGTWNQDRECSEGLVIPALPPC